MMLHPIVLALSAADLASAILLLLAGFGAARIAAHWSPGAPTRTQLALERRAEAVSLQGRWATAGFALATLVLIVAVADLLPALVPGAMCGTGVVQAAGGLFGRALALRLAALLLLGAWHLHDRFDRALPTAPLAPLPARLLLLAAPVAVIAALDTNAALRGLDLQTPVDCCTVVFDQVRSLHQATTLHGVSDSTLVALCLLLGAALATLAAAILLRGRRPHRPHARRHPPAIRATGLLLLLALAWIPVAGLALTRVFSAYYYGVLQHHCPWCLFLPEHHWVGYAFLLALLLVLLESGALFWATRLARRYPSLAAPARRRVRRGAARLLLGLALYGLLALLPALLWRLRYGVWISG